MLLLQNVLWVGLVSAGLLGRSELLAANDVTSSTNNVNKDAAKIETVVQEVENKEAKNVTAPEATTQPATATTSETSTAAQPTPAASSTSLQPASGSVSTTENSVSQTVTPASEPAAIDRGFGYFGLGLGLGMSNLADDTFAGSSAGLLSLRSGVILMDRFLVGLQVSLLGQYNKWAASAASGAALSQIMAEFTAFPLAWLPASASVGLGWGSALKLKRLADDNDGDPRVAAGSSNGLCFMGGLGYDFFAGQGLNLGLQARYDGSTGDLGLLSTGSIHLWLNWY